MLGRLGYRTLVRRVGVVPRTVVVMAAVAVTTVLIGVFTLTCVVLVIVTVAAGMARGVMTLLQATAVTERWGMTHYGHLSGLLSAPVMLATALGPFIGAALAGLLGGYAAMFVAARRNRRGGGTAGRRHRCGAGAVLDSVTSGRIGPITGPCVGGIDAEDRETQTSIRPHRGGVVGLDIEHDGGVSAADRAARCPCRPW